MTGVKRYETQVGSSIHPNERLLFTFISKGKKDIEKAIVYQRFPNTVLITKDSPKKVVFNLGFGDLKDDKSDIDDAINSNNGDMRIVFNTVLYTIPIFFTQYPECCIHVTGSDIKRKRIYSNFVSKHYETFRDEFSFFGLNKNVIMPFERYSLYDGVFLFKK